jgi:hypothetical protein
MIVSAISRVWLSVVAVLVVKHFVFDQITVYLGAWQHTVAAALAQS